MPARDLEKEIAIIKEEIKQREDLITRSYTWLPDGPRIVCLSMTWERDSYQCVECSEKFDDVTINLHDCVKLKREHQIESDVEFIDDEPIYFQIFSSISTRC